MKAALSRQAADDAVGEAAVQVASPAHAMAWLQHVFCRQSGSWRADR